MVAPARPALASTLVLAGASAVTLGAQSGSRAKAGSRVNAKARQTPEELGFTDVGDANDAETYGKAQFSEEFCLDIGAKGFPIPTEKMLQAANWDATKYFEQLQMAGYAEDALQMTAPDAAILKSDCMKERFHGRTKHIFVGDSQMMALRNAFHRLNKCPEIWFDNHTAQFLDDMMATVRRNEKGASKVKSNERFHSRSKQAPEIAELPRGCTE